MTKVPSLDYRKIVAALRLQKRLATETLKIIVPAHRPIKRSTPAHVLKQARLGVDDLKRLL